jgi:cell migration-inducing and hyaluronan-binding protein
MDDGSWVIFELPGFTTAASGQEVSSLAGLREVSETAYYTDGDTLWVKLVVDNESNATTSTTGPAGFAGGTRVEVSR